MTEPLPTDATRFHEVRYEHTPNLPEILDHVNSSLLVTTYQAGKLLILGTCKGQLTIAFSDFEQAMGLAVTPQRIAVGTRRQVHFFVPAHELAPQLEPAKSYDGCFVSRSSFYTGSIHGHDLAWGSDGLWVVNTLFSCLCTLHENYNFVPRWRPRFISQLADQDRCHLNGLAMQDGRPRYVTALAETDTPAGWRPTKAHSGCVIDVIEGSTIAGGLCMPHSPRIHQGRLWLLDSGTGRLGFIDTPTGAFESVEEMPGYTRGMAFAGQFAFVGLSKIRENAIFGGLPISEKHTALRCGLAIVDLIAGRTVAVFQFHSGVEEIFAVDVVSGIRNPILSGSLVDTQERDIWVVPPEEAPRPESGPTMPLFASGPDRLSRGQCPDPSELLQQSRRLQREGRLDEAADTLRRAIPLAPSPAPLWVDLGNLRQDQGAQEAALECYRQARAADPRCIAARQNLGYLLFNRGEPEAAVQEYERLLELDPSPMNQLLSSAVLPVVYETSSDVPTWRQRTIDRLNNIIERGATIDATRQLVPTCFFLAYQGLDDRPIMQLRGRIIQGATGGARDPKVSPPDATDRPDLAPT